MGNLYFRHVLQLFIQLLNFPKRPSFVSLPNLGIRPGKVCHLLSFKLIRRFSFSSSQCYWEELMLLKYELMLLKCQINTNTNKNGCLLPTKCLERVSKYSCLVSTILHFLINVCRFLKSSLWLLQTLYQSKNDRVLKNYFFLRIKIWGDDLIILSILDYFLNY